MNSKSTAPALGEIGQIALTVSDVEKAVAFYRDVLGLKHLFSVPPGLAFFACDSVRLMLSRPEGATAGAGSSSVIYFKTPDIEQTAAGLKTRGLTFEAEPRLIAKMPDHELWMAFFRDPDRNVLALMCEKR